MTGSAPVGGRVQAPDHSSPGHEPSPPALSQGEREPKPPLPLGEGGGEGASKARDFAFTLKATAVCLLIFVLALVPRLVALDTTVTIDESRWVQRAADFYALLDEGDPEDTFIIGHPGVTTMWTALLGMGPERALALSFREGRTDVTRRDGYFAALLAARVPFALLAAAGVAAVTLLGWRLLGAGPALVGGALLALEPFLVAHARVVHLDAALTVYTAVCLLASLVFWQAGGGPGYLVLSGVAGGLAFLTKAPSVFALGVVPLLALAAARRRPPRAWIRSALPLLLWGLVAGAVCLALWPALRANPVGTLLRMAEFTERVGGGEHDNFFLGSPGEDPGPLFYPLALLFRLSPLTLLGLGLVGAAGRRLSADRRRTVLTLGAYCLGFGLMMTLAPKKFDRYLLPIFPLLGLLAGLGLWMFVERLRNGSRVVSSPSIAALLLLALLGLQALVLASVSPYYLAYYNPVLGGGAVAQRALLVGWGEGLDQVARYLNEQPRPLGAPTVATSYHRVLQAHLDGSALPLERVEMADYVVPYVNTLQRGAEREALAPYLDAGRPELVVWINGIEYARVYRGPHHPDGGPVGADFGGRATLLEFLAAPGDGRARAGDELEALLRWDGATAGDERAQLALLGPDGRAVAQSERPVGADGPDRAGRPGEIHRLAVPARVPAGEYRLAVRVTDPRTRASLPPVGSWSIDGEWVVLRTVVVERGP